MHVEFSKLPGGYGFSEFLKVVWYFSLDAGMKEITGCSSSVSEAINPTVPG
jgi:hypothetical protein